MNKLIKNIENFNILKKIQIKNEKMIIEVFSMNNRIDNMIRVMKKNDSKCQYIHAKNR